MAQDIPKQKERESVTKVSLIVVTKVRIFGAKEFFDPVMEQRLPSYPDLSMPKQAFLSLRLNTRYIL
jgi:hypothetical protein